MNEGVRDASLWPPLLYVNYSKKKSRPIYSSTTGSEAKPILDFCAVHNLMCILAHFTRHEYYYILLSPYFFAENKVKVFFLVVAKYGIKALCMKNKMFQKNFL